MLEYISNSSEETIALGEKIGKCLKAGDVILLIADLSGGKTTITKGIGKALGVKRVINSPTFTIVKEYSGDIKLYHLDLYRLDGVGEDFDLEEYFEGDAVAVVEWPSQASDLLPKEYIKIELERLGDNSRKITITEVGQKYEGRIRL